jgi:HMGL-like
MQSVQVVEVAPRDGLQNERAILPTEAKLELVTALAATGVRRIEVTSFVSQDRVPQLAASEALCARLPRGQVSWIGLVLNERGLDRAIRAGVDEVNVVVVATNRFSERNQGVSTAGAIAAWERMAARAREAGLRTTVTIAAAFGCPFEGEVAPERVAAVLRGPLAEIPDVAPLVLGVPVGCPLQHPAAVGGDVGDRGGGDALDHHRPAGDVHPVHLRDTVLHPPVDPGPAAWQREVRVADHGHGRAAAGAWRPAGRCWPARGYWSWKPSTREPRMTDDRRK